MKRRQFLKAGVATLGAGMVPSVDAVEAADRVDTVAVTPVQILERDTTRHWLGPAYWGNRLQDWRLHGGRIECLRHQKSYEVRTCSVLTRGLNGQHQSARLQVKVGNLTPGKPGFCGFLLGIGEGRLDYRGCALAQRIGGEGGGFLAVIDSDGELSFRDFANPDKPLEFEVLQRTGAVPAGEVGDRELLLDCHIDPVSNGRFDIRLIARDADTDQELGFAVRTGIVASDLSGGVSLVSSPSSHGDGARWWFSDLATGGGKIDIRDERGLGPVMGCMHSLNRDVLKLTAQLMPVDVSRHKNLRLDYRAAGGSIWTKGPVSNIEEGFVALFRLESWNAHRTHDYRVVFPEAEDETLYTGQIVQDPGSTRTIKVALYSCILPTSRSLDDPEYQANVPQEVIPGRYRPENILFPHHQLVKHCDHHRPDLYVFCGDQYYETYPTRPGRHTADAKLDTLYRWYLWYWTFRESVRNRPAIMLADDHDILQGNLWGQAGKNSEQETEEAGGFKWNKSLVRMVYRMQHGHNPDAYDPTPIDYDIPVTYGHFVYGGVSFAVIEDRKFKTAPDYDGDPKTKRGELLGERQERFLRSWVHMDKGLPKICLTASIWGSPQTQENRQPLLDYDANGYPPDGRTRAVKLLRDAGALVLAGDQHLGMVARQGVDDFEDGPLFFAGPAAAAFWQRWFEGDGKLDNRRNDDPNTGNFVDAFGNRMRVLAVANPKISYRKYMAGKRHWGMFLADPSLKSEGYGIVQINHKQQQFTLECWPWDANPDTQSQFAGWPLETPFEWPATHPIHNHSKRKSS